MSRRRYRVLLAIVLAACGGSPRQDATESASALVSDETFGRASDAVRGIDYLPFDYLEDGCYARSLYMAMELASRGIESNAIYAIANAPPYLQVDGVQWWWHVAPMLLLGGDYEHARAVVLDPGLSAEPLEAHEWIGRMVPWPQGTPNYPDYVITPGTTYGVPSTLPRNVPADVKSFEAMPKFQANNIASACARMSEYIVAASGGEAKVARLVARTTELAEALERRGKLDEHRDFSDCASR
jgi:hypothetical protein